MNSLRVLAWLTVGWLVALLVVFSARYAPVVLLVPAARFVRRWVR